MKKEIKKEMSKEKKKTLIITISLAVIALVLMLCFIFMELREMGIIGSSESNEIMKEFNYSYNSDERKVIYYSSSECGYCKMQTPILELIAEDYDLEYCSIDSTKLSKKQANIVLDKLGIENATPTTVIVEDGKVIDVQEGYVDGRELVDFFKENKVLEEDAVYSAEKYITYVDYNKYRSLTRSEETSIIVIGQSTCSHCIAIKPALNSVAEDYNLTINYLNLTELNEDETNKFYESLEDIEYNDPDFVKDGSFGTPLTMVVEDGKIVDYISGSRTISQLVRKFRQLGLIEE